MQVSDGPHPGHGSQIDIEGYRSCRNEWCGALVLVEITRHTGGLCSTCFSSELGGKIAAVEVISRGQRTRVRLTKGHNGPRSGKGDRDTQRKAEKAKTRALKRMRALFPELYDIFYAEERARVGLPAWTIPAALSDPGEGVEQTLGFAQMYHALTEHGADVDGLEIQSENEDARPR